MFKSILVTSLLALSLGLAGCGDSAEKKAKDAVKEGKQNHRVMNKLLSELAQVGIVALTGPETEVQAKAITTKSLKEMNQETLQTALKKIKELRSAAMENLEIVARDDVKGGDPKSYQSIVKNCNRIQKEIEALLAEKSTQAPATEETEEPKPTQAIPGTHIA